MITQALMLLGKFTIAHAPTILSVIGEAHVAATGYFGAKSGMEYQRRIDEGEELTTEDKVAIFAKPVISGVTGIACVFTGDRMHVVRNRKLTQKVAAVSGAASVIQSHYDSYRNATKFVHGDDKNVTEKKNDVEANAIWEACKRNGIEPIDTHTGTDLWFESYSRQWLLASEDHIVRAEYHTNRNCALRGNSPFNEFLRFLGAEEDPEYEIIHWDLYEGEAYYGYQWIDFIHQYDLTLRDGTKYNMIAYPFEPHLSEK